MLTFKLYRVLLLQCSPGRMLRRALWRCTRPQVTRRKNIGNGTSDFLDLLQQHFPQANWKLRKRDIVTPGQKVIITSLSLKNIFSEPSIACQKLECSYGALCRVDPATDLASCHCDFQCSKSVKEGVHCNSGRSPRTTFKLCWGRWRTFLH